jgi:hypothetical protein
MTNRNINTSTIVNTGDMTNRNINTSTSVSTNNNVNTGDMTNRNINNSTSVSTNNNVSTGDMTNRNINTSTTNSINNNVSTGDMTNRNINTTTSTTANTNNSNSNNINVDTSTSTVTQNVDTNSVNTNVSDSTSYNESQQQIEQTINTPPPSAIAPSMMSYSQDLCTVGVSGAIQTQIFGLSAGKSTRDENCERMKLSKTLYDMGMRVASVSLLCQDERVYLAMEMAGTPCPFMGKIADEASIAWAENPEKVPGYKESRDR